MLLRNAGPFSGLILQVVPSYLGFQGVLPQECPSVGGCPVYGMNSINAPDLWNRLVAVPNFGSAATARRGCVIDTGVRFNHLDLTANLLTAASATHVTKLNHAGNTVTPAAGGDNMFAGPDPAGYFSGHGTHVAGIMVGVWNAVVPEGIVGVDGQNAKVASCRIFDDQGPHYEDDSLKQCLQHATSNNLQVINLSVGGPNTNAPPYIRDAIQAACKAGAIVTISAGNGVNTSTGIFQGVNIAGMTAATSPSGFNVSPIWPANFAGTLACVITVASVDITNTLAFNSNYGNNVRIAAPGVDIRSDYNLPLTDSAPNATLSGTSMAVGVGG